MEKVAATASITDNPIVQQGYILAPHEIDSLRQALGAHTQILGATEDGYISGEQGSGPVMIPGLRGGTRRKLSEQAKQIKHTLDTCSPQPIPEKDRDKFVKEAKRLEEIFKPYLETRAELHVLKRDSPFWNSAMEKARYRSATNPDGSLKHPEIEGAISKWKYIQRRLNPEDPDADNLHKLRAEKV